MSEGLFSFKAWSSKASMIVLRETNFRRKYQGIKNVKWKLHFILIGRTYSSYFMHAIVARMRLPFFKIFSNFLHVCLNFQTIYTFFLPFLCKIVRMLLLSEYFSYRHNSTHRMTKIDLLPCGMPYHIC